MEESDDDYDYSREVPISSDEEDDELLQVVLGKLLEYMSANRLSLDALFRKYDRDREGWTQKSFGDALRGANLQLSESEAHTAFATLAHGGGDSTRITSRTFHDQMHAAKRLHLGERVRSRETRQLPPVDRSRRMRVFERADAAQHGGAAAGWLLEEQAAQALAELYPGFEHAEIMQLAFEAALAPEQARANAEDGHAGRIRLREFDLLIEYVRYFSSTWETFEDVGRHRSLTLPQFKAACGKVLPQDITAREAEHEFNELYLDDTGKVPFEEFCKWAVVQAVPGSDHSSSSGPPRDSRASQKRPRGPVLRQNLKMQTSMGMRWETLHVVIDSTPEEVGKEVFTFAVYSSEQAYNADERARVGPFAVSDCVCITPDDHADQFRLALVDTEYRFKATATSSALRVADAVRGCQYCELINWDARELRQWLELSGIPEPTLQRVLNHSLPGMLFAKLCARDDMVARLQEELEEMTGLPDTAILELLRPVRSLQSEEVRVFLEESNRREKGRRPEIDGALKVWKQQVAIENAKLKHGGAHVPQHATLIDDGAPDFSSEEELDDEEEGVLYVTVVKADKLPRLDKFGYDRVSPPSLYVQMNMEDQQRNTPTADGTYEPKWNARFKFDVTHPESILLIDVYNSNMMTDHLHWATLKVPLIELAEGTTWNWYRLTDMEDESRSEARHNVLTEEERQDRENCRKGCVQLRFQYTPPKLALDRHHNTGVRINTRRGAVTDIERFVGAYAADSLDVEARITQGLLWSTRYVVISSMYKGNPPTEKFILLTYKDKRAWDNGAEALSTLRLGQSEIVIDSRPESRGAGFAVTNRQGSAHFRARNADEAAEWLTALRALQFAEMTQWNAAHICRWLEAHNVDQGILQRVHESGVSGQFFARTVAANNYDKATTQLQEKASLSNSDATAIISKLRDAQLGSVQVGEWIDEANRDIHGKSAAIKQSSALLRSHGVQAEQVGYEPAGGAGGAPRRRSGEAEFDARHTELTQRLAHVQGRINRRGGGAGAGAGSGGSSTRQRFDPKKWQEEQYQRSTIIEQKKLLKEQEELLQHQAQTRGENLNVKYPRGKDVYTGGGNNPDFSKVQSKYKKEAAQYREKVVERSVNESAAALQQGRTVVAAPVAAKLPRQERIPMTEREKKRLAELRDPKKLLEPRDAQTGNRLATKLESLVAVHRNLQEHQELVDAICEYIREKDVSAQSSKKERGLRKKREKDHKETFQRCRQLEVECDRLEQTVKSLQTANEGAMERYHKTRDLTRQFEDRRKKAQIRESELQAELEIRDQAVKQYRDKLGAAQGLLKDMQMENASRAQSFERASNESEVIQKLRDENDRLKQDLQKTRDSCGIYHHEAQERGKVLVGAAEKLEKEQEKFRNMKSKLEKRAVAERSEGRREGQQEADRQLSELKQYMHNATEMVFEISQALGVQDGSRFKDTDEMNRVDLIKAVKDAVAKTSKQDAERKAAQKEVRRLKEEVKELKKHLRQEQDHSYKMLSDMDGGAKSKGKDKGKDKGGGGDAQAEELARLKSLIAVHETQMEGERRNTAKEKDRVMKLEQELRRHQHDLRSQRQHAEELARHRVHMERTAETEDRHTKAQMREAKQEQRLSKMHAGQWVQKYHDGGRSDKRWLSLSIDNKMLTYGKSKAKSTKEIPIDDIRYIHFGYVSENMTARHADIVDTPEWMCFGIVLKTRTIDFSAETEEDAALWVVGLRTLLEQKRGDARGRAVGHFLWSRASMKTKARWESSLEAEPGRYKSHMDYVAQKLLVAAETWRDSEPRGAISTMSAAATQLPSAYGGGSPRYGSGGYAGGGYAAGGYGATPRLTASSGVARRLSPGVTRRPLSPEQMSFGSPPSKRFSPTGNPRSPGGVSYSGGGGLSLSRISPGTGAAPSTRLASPARGRSQSPSARHRDYPRRN